MTLPVQHQSVDRITIDAWQGQLAEAARDPWLASEIVHRGDEIVPRFAYFYHKLSTLPRRIRRALQRKGSLTFAGLALMLALGNAPAQAATIPVDGTTCTLADAITAANTDTATGGCLAGSGADTLELEPGSVHTLTTALPDISSEITIEGHGATIQRDSAAPDFPVVHNIGNFTLNETTLSGGKGGIIMPGDYWPHISHLSITDSTITGNDGSGVHAYRQREHTITITDSTITGNNGSGVDVYGIYSPIAITNSTISDNTGTGVRHAYSSAKVTITNSTISGNGGGGVSTEGVWYYDGFQFTITNSTISGNTTGGSGGGVAIRWADVYHPIDVSIADSTITGNVAAGVGGGVWNNAYNENSSMTIVRSLISSNTAPVGPEISFTYSSVYLSLNSNLLGFDGDAGLDGVTPGPTDIVPAAGVQVSDILDPTLADNGGPTLTHALVTGSPAIDAIPDTDPGCLGTDQRGVARPQGSGCDIGAFELEREEPPPVTLTSDQDSMLRPQPRSENRNEGANPLLHLSGRQRVVVGFDLTNVDLSQVERATLVLTINDDTPPADWGEDGGTVAVHRLLDAWVEGDSKAFGVPAQEKTRGFGPGVTWTCAIDAQIANRMPDCELPWDGGAFDLPPTDAVRHTDGMTGEVVFDVTADVQDGGASWLIKKARGGNVRYYATDHLEVETDPNLAPRLVLDFAQRAGR